VGGYPQVKKGYPQPLKFHVMYLTKIVSDTPEKRGLNVRPPCYNSNINKKRKVVKMTTLTKKQYQLIWVGSNMGWAGTIQALFSSETKAWDYLSQKVLDGWVVLETTLNEIN